MTRKQLIDAIARLQGFDANRPHLATKTTGQLVEMLARWRAIAAVTPAECARHCQPYPLRRAGA